MKYNDTWPAPKEVDAAKAKYPPGTRISLVRMHDPYAPVPPGTLGTVDAVDDIGQIHMKWDNGRALALIPGVDSFTAIRADDRPTVQDTASVSFLRKQYPVGADIQLIAMKSPCSSIRSGMFGRVAFVDDDGQIHVLWENGKTVPVVPGVDKFQAVWRG